MSELVSVILTCYYEGPMLEQSAPVLMRFLAQSGLNSELVLVIDGSDQETDEALARLSAAHPEIRVLRNAQNIGRGGSVARGVREACGGIVGFIDPDLEIAPSVIPAMVAVLAQGVDLVVARRQVPLGPRNLVRWILSKGYKLLANAMLSLPDLDTEAGCKFFRAGTVLPVIEGIENQRWFWDTELVARTYHAGLRVAQVPVPYTRNTDHATTVNLRRDVPEYLRELRRLRGQILARGRARQRAHT
jgi:glycosyltransferase involved in cell wall biosynthesis